MLLIFQPLIGGLLSNRFTGIYIGPRLSVQNIFITFQLSQICFYEVLQSESSVTIRLGDWQNYEQINIDWSFTFDSLTMSMYQPVITISQFVQQFSLSYMKEDPHITRFFFLQSIFSFFMIILITGDNFQLLFCGWEFVGLSSYQLVNFWYTRIAANQASMKAFLMNKIGDFGLQLGVLLLLSITSDQSFSVVMPLAHLINSNLLFIILILFMIGAMAKSAQFGLHNWLSDAMEGPTPVSALIHAATMVTAGVYLFLRISPLLEFSEINLIIITWLGSITALFGACCGLLEHDLKKVIAFSTSSQLGYMVLACGTSQYNVALFHLINHAFFKALLFQSAGAVLHAINDEQDMRKHGSLILFQPITYACFIIGSQSLVAFPFLTGFYSKDFQLELLFTPNNITHTIAFLIGQIAAFLTSIYSAKLQILSFISKPHFNNKLVKYIQDPLDLPSLIVLISLSFAAIFSGYLTQDIFLGFGNEIFSNSLFTHPNHFRQFDGTLSEFTFLKLIVSQPLIILLTIIPFSNQIKNIPTTIFSIPTSFTPVPLYWNTRILTHFNIFYHWIMHNSLNNSILLYRYFDKGLLQLIGPFGIFRFLNYITFKIEQLATGFILHYALITLLTLLSLILVPFITYSIIILQWVQLSLQAESSLKKAKD